MGQIKNIDCVYLINLEQRNEKLAKSLNELAAFSIQPQRMNAIYGWGLPRSEIERVAFKFGQGMDSGCNKICKPIRFPTEIKIKIPTEPGEICYYPTTNLGAFGCALSHLEVLRHAYQTGAQRIWVLEDDFTVAKDPHLLGDLIEELTALDPEWDLLYTDDRDSFTAPFIPGTIWRPDGPSTEIQPCPRTSLGHQFVRIGGRRQMRSVIVQRSGMEKILAFERQGIFLPYPLEILFIPHMKLYNSSLDIVCGNKVSTESSDVLYNHF
jgi:hypothetical protein